MTDKSFSDNSIPPGYSMYVIKLFFWVGLISALLLRLVIIADHFSDFSARVLWYLGVFGYLLFFSHRYNIAKRRFNVINELNILEKIQKRKTLTDTDYKALNYLLWSISVSKERLNYLIIIVFSIIAITISLTLDFGLAG